MLRLFKNMRHQLEMGNGVRRYLKYALGEIILVVVGILIALQIDSWNDDRLDRIQERAYLGSMLTDLREDVRGNHCGAASQPGSAGIVPERAAEPVLP